MQNIPIHYGPVRIIVRIAQHNHPESFTDTPLTVRCAAIVMRRSSKNIRRTCEGAARHNRWPAFDADLDPELIGSASLADLAASISRTEFRSDAAIYRVEIGR